MDKLTDEQVEDNDEATTNVGSYINLDNDAVTELTRIVESFKNNITMTGENTNDEQAIITTGIRYDISCSILSIIPDTTNENDETGFDYEDKDNSDDEVEFYYK